MSVSSNTIKSFMANNDQQHGSSDSGSGSSYVLCATMVAVVIGGPLVGMMSFTFLATLTLLLLTSPLLILFSPILVPAAFFIVAAVAGFVTALAVAVAGVSTVTWGISRWSLCAKPFVLPSHAIPGWITVTAADGQQQQQQQQQHMVGIHSHHLDMGTSLEERGVLEFEDESLVSPVSIKMQPLDVTHNAPPPQVQVWSMGRLFKSIQIIMFSTKINLLMPFGPAAIIVHYLTQNHGWVFFLSLVGITPLAERLGFATEQLTFFTGPTVGGLLNATFGNATELIISIYALKHGLIRVVQQSLLGSILSNMLLVLGCAFFSGGIVFNRKEQVFNKVIKLTVLFATVSYMPRLIQFGVVQAAAVLNSGLLLMAVMGLTFPAVLHFTHTEIHFGKSELALSRFSSCIMLVAYAAFLFFQLKSQKNLYVPVNEGSQTEGSSDDDEVPEISKWESIIWLAILTAWISILSEYLVDALQGASIAWNIPIAFISVILLPIVGNAAEHASAIMFAMKDKLDISLGVAIGSSTQISMFGIPFCVVVGWIMGRPMDLNFQLFETATLFITVLVVAFLLQDGTSNYFKGLMLILCYLIVAASFYVHVDPTSVEDKPPKN
ncbi:hypothetical protein GIB67_039987 [Kingdonia uniflora]|uniref:Sodium/calcium exchanger membrane region domain-containing protein n=1 Tax=Kingdonia uniflora TaxID=39325 RepID=A0A7J7LID7_9MAGN|nr:hypothetical protein GIB67_039987 [Kingdonia uniflora]